MFWTNHHLTPKLESAELDGRNHRVIRKEGLGRPRTLTADYRSERIYWFSPELGKNIMSVSIDGEKTGLFPRDYIFPKCAALRENIVLRENIPILAPPTGDISSVLVDICYIRWSK